MEKFIMVEVGSTNTKASLYDGEIKYLSRQTIEFKSNFKKEQKIKAEDKQKLYDFIHELKAITPQIFVYGTSIFRELNDNAKESWLKEFKVNTGLEFTIVSAIDENRYTTMGAFPNTKDNIAIMIGGGGSTELAIYNDGKLVEQECYNFGVTTVTDIFPDLRDDKVTTDYDLMVNETRKLIEKKPQYQADILIMAGGDFLYFFEEAHYPSEKNKFYDNSLQPIMLDIERATECDKDFFYNVSLDEIGARTNNDAWWRGTRAMRLCAKALCEELGVKYIVPTRINMTNGLIKEILNNEKTK